MSLKIAHNPNALVVAPSRKRETPQPRVTFRKVMEGGAQLLAAGARVATQIVGGPFLSAAVTGAGAAAAAGATGASSGSIPGLGSGPLGIGNGGQDPLAAFHDKRMSDDLQLLALQDRIQRSNRQIALVSNVMKARHDTAKAAISNIRS